MTKSMTPKSRIAHYEIKKGLGRGAMGSVYLAVDKKMEREVAIKILQRDFAQNPKHRARFDREARAIAALHHPNIVRIFDYGGSPDDVLYLVMEYIAGRHMGWFCRKYSPVPETVLGAIGCELAAALGHAHKFGIIHRDLKPENVFLDRGRLILADFGIAKAIAENSPLGAEAASPRTDIIGTPGFMAPEQLHQQVLDARTDIFSFGAFLYYLASMRVPYQAESPYALMKEFREKRPLPLIELRPDLSERFSRLVQDCVEVEKDFRPHDTEFVRKTLRRVLDDCGAPDVRDILEAYQDAPLQYQKQDQQRTINYLIAALKIAVRDDDAILADSIRGRLARLDPNNEESQRMSGVQQLFQQYPLETDPEIVIARLGHRKMLAMILSIVFGLGIIGIMIWLHGLG